MKLEKIIIELKEIEKEQNIIELNDLIERLEKEFKENNYCKKASDKVKLSAIKKLILAKHNDCRPILQSFTPLKNGQVAFTDSYSLFIINDKELPFRVAFQEDWSKEEKENYLKGKELETIEHNFPNIQNFVPNESDKIKDFKMNTTDINTLYKTTLKDSNSHKAYTFNDKEISFTLDLEYLENAIKILQLKNEFNLEYYGEYRPLIIRNNNEIGLILPMRTY